MNPSGFSRNPWWMELLSSNVRRFLGVLAIDCCFFDRPINITEQKLSNAWRKPRRIPTSESDLEFVLSQSSAVRNSTSRSGSLNRHQARPQMLPLHANGHSHRAIQAHQKRKEFSCLLRLDPCISRYEGDQGLLPRESSRDGSMYRCAQI